MSLCEHKNPARKPNFISVRLVNFNSIRIFSILKKQQCKINNIYWSGKKGGNVITLFMLFILKRMLQMNNYQ